MPDNSSTSGYINVNDDLPCRLFGSSDAISTWAFLVLVQVADGCLILVAGAGALFLASHVTPGQQIAIPTFLMVVLLIAVAVNLIFGACHLYNLNAVRCPSSSILTVIGAWCVAIGAMVSITLLPGVGTPQVRLWAMLWFLLGGCILATARLFAAAAIRSLSANGSLRQNIYLVGNGDAIWRCIKAAQDDEVSINILGYFTDEPCGDFPFGRGVHRLGRMAEVARYAQLEQADSVVLALTPAEVGELPRLVAQLQCIPVQVCVVLCFVELPLVTRTVQSVRSNIGSRLGKMPVFTISDRPLSDRAWIVKDVQDRAIAVLMLVIFAPVMLAIALAIRASSPGPILFQQIRRGFGGREFMIYKFRSMHALSQISYASDAKSTERLAMTAWDDPRLFIVGRFLRKTSLDELPQLFNVILGDMWLIGPRPHSPMAHVGGVFYSEAVDQYIARYRIKPGITGWAQVNGWRGPTVTLEQIRKRVEYDLFYVENWSTAFDLRILLMTLRKGFLHENAF